MAAVVLAILVRERRRSFGWTLAGALCLMVAFGIWLTVVAPVNAAVSEALRAAPTSVPAVWMQFRTRWDGHVAGFIAQLAGFSALAVSVLVETPTGLMRDSEAQDRSALDRS